MATTPPPDEQPTTVQPSAGSSYTVNVSDIARMPIPGNAEFLVWLLCADRRLDRRLDDRQPDGQRLDDLLHVHDGRVPDQPRMAKASRVLEQ